MATLGFTPLDRGSAAEPSEAPPDLERTVRFAAFTLGGLVMLALGVSLVAESLGPVLEDVYAPEFPGGIETVLYFLTVPVLGAGFVLVAVAVALLLVGRKPR